MGSRLSAVARMPTHAARATGCKEISAEWTPGNKTHSNMRWIAGTPKRQIAALGNARNHLGVGDSDDQRRHQHDESSQRPGDAHIEQRLPRVNR